MACELLQGIPESAMEGVRTESQITWFLPLLGLVWYFQMHKGHLASSDRKPTP